MATAPKLQRIKAEDLRPGDVIFPDYYPAIVCGVGRMRSGNWCVRWEGGGLTIVPPSHIFHVFEPDPGVAPPVLV